MTVMIPRNSTINCKITRTFTTYQDNQTFVNVAIYEGERQLTKDNRRLGILFLDGIPPLPRCQAKIEITFDYNSNQSLSVTVIEKLTGKKKSILISRETKKTSSKGYDPLTKELKKLMID